ncbi:hypothetical protein N0V83_001321 [Neocucurbitaria cava]|uniref:Uncharacterized protein n=1 Tax=Neocucurbitaria cava TaxID=798079 RepID=A0A9W8YFG8_9PLEO|nr:hypothetical protein N0V83_001321 [Neocucurbitaria cava]
MKCIFNIFLASLAAIALAISPASKSHNYGLSPLEARSNATEEQADFRSLVDNITIFDVSHRYNESENRARSAAWENFTLPWKHDGDTALQTAETADDPKTWKAYIRIGGTRQHIGTLRKQRLWDSIHDCLKLLCDFDVGSKNPCYNTPAGDTFVLCKVPHHIVYSDKGKYAYNAYIEIMVRAAWYNPSYPGLAEALWSQIAGIYKTLSESDSNCYNTDFANSRSTTMCVVPQFALAAFPHHKKQPDGVVSISLTFNGNTDKGDASCNDQMKQKAVDFFNSNVRNDIAAAYQHHGDKIGDIGVDVACVTGDKSLEDCFGPKWSDCTARY